MRAQARYVRGSARKARVVLEHIRGKSVVAGPCGAAVHAAGRRARDPLRARVGRRERRGEPRARARRAAHRGGLRRRGPDPQALAAACTRPRHAHPQAHLSPDRRAATRPVARRGSRPRRQADAAARPRGPRSRRRSAPAGPARPSRPRPPSRPTSRSPPTRPSRRRRSRSGAARKAAAEAPAA